MITAGQRSVKSRLHIRYNRVAKDIVRLECNPPAGKRSATGGHHRGDATFTVTLEGIENLTAYAIHLHKEK